MPRVTLVPQIVQQIQDHIRLQDLPAGAHLPAQYLADLFRVSRAPVSAALRQLADDGILRAEPHRGFFLVKSASDLAVEAAPEAPEDPLYYRIAEDRLSGQLPDKISENQLMRLYGVARMRLRNLLYQIAEEGWIERLPAGGWTFRETLSSPRAYEESYQFRAAIEMQALLLPEFTPDPQAFAAARAHQEALLHSYTNQGRQEIFGTNVDFHEMLMICAHNSFFLDAVKRVNRVRRLMEYRVTADRSRLPQQIREHIAILDLIETGDMHAAATYLFSHITTAGKIKARQIRWPDAP